MGLDTWLSHHALEMIEWDERHVYEFKITLANEPFRNKNYAEEPRKKSDAAANGNWSNFTSKL